jgi:hypothetical protein
MTDTTNLSSLRDTLLAGIEGGELHQREKVGNNNSLPYKDFVEIGQLLRAFGRRSHLVEILLEVLAPHRDVIIGVLPPGVQRHGLIADLDQPMSDDQLLASIQQIPEDDIRQWIIHDGSLIYGELTKQELQSYFQEITKLLKHTDQFIDLGSGLGKVVMTAALSLPFRSCIGVELMPYRHQLALQRFEGFCQDIARELEKLPSDTSPAVNLSNETSPCCEIEHIRQVPQRVAFELADMFTSDISQASLIFMYSTCFGSIMHKIAEKLANEAPEGCLVSATSYTINHPGFRLIKHFPAKSVAWTDVRIYERVGQGPWPIQQVPKSVMSDVESWKNNARSLLS